MVGNSSIESWFMKIQVLSALKPLWLYMKILHYNQLISNMKHDKQKPKHKICMEITDNIKAIWKELDRNWSSIQFQLFKDTCNQEDQLIWTHPPTLLWSMNSQSKIHICKTKT